MPQQLTLKTAKGVTLAELGRFYREATDDFQIPERTKLRVRSEGEGEDAVYYFSVFIDEKVRNRSIRVKKRKKEREIEQAVKEQIEKHKQDVKEGKKIAHVPPVKGTVKRKVKRKRKKEETIEGIPMSQIDKAIQEIKENTPPFDIKPKKKKKNTSAYKSDKVVG